MCNYPHVVVTGASSGIGRAAVTAHADASGLAGLVNNADIGVFGQLAVTRAFVPVLRRAQGRIVITGCASAARCAAVRRELAPWNTHVVLLGPANTQPEGAARAVAQALTTPHPRARPALRPHRVHDPAGPYGRMRFHAAPTS